MLKKLKQYQKTPTKDTLDKQKSENIQSIQKQQPILIDNKTIVQFRQELKFVEQKIIDLQNKKYTASETEWGNLRKDISQILAVLQLEKLKKVFERKFVEEIRLLNDFYSRKYHQSMFKLCFFCCPQGILRELKVYRFIDDIFQLSISDVNKTQRNTYFYVNLLYIKLFCMMIDLGDVIKVEFNKKMVQAMEIQARQDKLMQTRKKQVGQLQQINDVYVMEYGSFKNMGQQQKGQSSYKIESDNLAIATNKLQPKQPLKQQLIHQNHYDELKIIEKEIQTIVLNDWKQIINSEEWVEHSYFGFIQIDSGSPIETSLQFKDCKLKTKYLFGQISSSSFDLRTYIVRKSRKINKSYQYVLDSLYNDSVDFTLRFWLAQSQRTKENHDNIDKFLLLAMRIGIKQKIARMSNLFYKQRSSHWMIHNYIHMLQEKKHHEHHRHRKNKEEAQNQSSFHSVESASVQLSSEVFWWQNLGHQLIRAIVEVAKQKIQKQNTQLVKVKPSFSKKAKSKVSLESDNPQSYDRLTKQNKNSKYISAYEI